MKRAFWSTTLIFLLFIVGCTTVKRPELNPNDPRLQDDLIDSPSVTVRLADPITGDPVVAPNKISPVQTTNAPSSFGSEHYIWEDWDLQ